MGKPKPEDIWLIQTLLDSKHINESQVRDILEKYKTYLREETPIDLGTLLVVEKKITAETLKNVLNQQPILPTKNLETILEETSKLDKPLEEDLPDITKHYTVQKRLGVGSVGSSYLVSDVAKQLFVLKHLRPEFLQNEKYINLVKKQLTLIDYKHHSNLASHVPMEIAQQQFFVSPYVPYDSIEVFVKAGEQLDLSFVLEILKRICDAMRFFERINLPINGLHARNIFRLPDGKIVFKDFEWVRGYFKEITHRRLMGSQIAYMSPEFLNGQEADLLNDTYSFGVLTYFMITKNLPFIGDIDVQMEHKLKAEYPALMGLHLDLPVYIEALVRRLLDPNREKRLKSFSEIYTFLEEIIRRRNAEITARRLQLSLAQKNIDAVTGKRQVQLLEKDVKSQKRFSLLEKGKIIAIVLALLVLGAVGLFLIISKSNHKLITEKAVLGGKSQPVGNNSFVEKEKNKEQTSPIISTPQNQLSEEEVNQLLSKQIISEIDHKKFSLRIEAIKAVNREKIEAKNVSPVQIQRWVTQAVSQVEEERQRYWETQKVKLLKLLETQKEKDVSDLLATISEETGNDMFLQNKIFSLRVTTHKLVLEGGDKVELSQESLLLKSNLESESKFFILNHDYSKLTNLYIVAMQKEKNALQKQIYKEEFEFYEQAEKVKEYALNLTIQSHLLLRSLYIDVDGELEAVSAKGFLTKDNNNKLIPWDKITMLTLSALVARYEPKTLGECISLLIYATRANNLLAMQKAIQAIKIKYSSSMGAPLVKESVDKLELMQNILSEEDIQLRISMIKTLKNRNTANAKHDAGILIKELRDEYLSSPMYKKFDADITDLTSALQSDK